MYVRISDPDELARRGNAISISEEAVEALCDAPGLRVTNVRPSLSRCYVMDPRPDHDTTEWWVPIELCEQVDNVDEPVRAADAVGHECYVRVSPQGVDQLNLQYRPELVMRIVAASERGDLVAFHRPVTRVYRVYDPANVLSSGLPIDGDLCERIGYVRSTVTPCS
jgi:hypothetical protein